MSIPKMILLFCEALLLAAFVMPVFMDIINPGNIIGMLVSVLLLAVTAWSGKVFAFIRAMWGGTGGKIILCAAAAVIAFSVCFAGYLSFRMIKAYNNTPPRPVTVVVLGCHVKGTEPSLMLARRLDAAYDYMTENPDVKCIVTGGRGTGEDITEAEAMKTYLTKKGISPDRIIEENKSVNTSENLAFAKAKMDENGIDDDIVIVTDGFHQYRASLDAEKLGLVSYSISCPTRTELVPTFWVREWFALAREIFLR